MPIKRDNANITIEFAWQSEENEEILYVKHHVENGVPTVSVSDDNKEWYNFPTAFFKEVTEFLVQQKVFNTAPKTGFRTTGGPPAPNFVQGSNLGGISQGPAFVQGIGIGSGGLPLPQIDGGAAMSDAEPIESFAGIEALAKNTSIETPSRSKPRKNDLDGDIIERPVIRGASEDMSRKLRNETGEASSFRRVDSDE